MPEMTRQLLQRGLNLLIAFLVLRAWSRMFHSMNTSVLSSAGLASLRYFTVLSNLLEAFASLLFCIHSFTGWQHDFLIRLKFTACVCVALTFFTVIFFLGPLYGYPAMFRGANFWLHLVVPLLAMGEFIFLNDLPLGFRDNLIAVLPMILYGIWYLANNLLHPGGEGAANRDFYGFLRWGLPTGLIFFTLIPLCTFAIGAGLRFLNHKIH